MHILVSPNAFKNSLTAQEAAEAIKMGLTDSLLPCTITCFPVGDGGDGTSSLILQNKKSFSEQTLVTDPIGRKIYAPVGFIDDGQTAIIEMSDSSGIKLLLSGELNPLRSSSYGTGELIKYALNRKVNRVILCIGGSATVDGGCGILQSLGMRFLDQHNHELTSLPEHLSDLETIDDSHFDPRIFQTEFIVLCDVNNYLLGDQGAAAVFGPQKGASQEDVIKLEYALTKFTEVVRKKTGKNLNDIFHGGAAGGVAASMSGLFRASLVQGIEYFLDLTAFDASLQHADLVITGEGTIDRQTLEGKGPCGVALRSKQKNIPVIAFAGTVSTDKELTKYFSEIIPVNVPGEPLHLSMKNTASNLRRAANDLGKKLKTA